MRRTTRALACLLFAMALIAGACSSDRDDEPVATDDEGSTTTSAADGDDGEGEGETFGDLESPCGEADEENADTGSEQGVTADEVVIGYGDDAGFPTSPGLSQETSDAM